MKLVEMTTENYLKLAASATPAPGGGSASALYGAQGIALIGMVAKLTAGKRKYSDFKEKCEQVALEADEITEKLYGQIDADTDAYNRIADSFKLPKNTEEEKNIRKAAIQSATVYATEVPLNTMRMGVQGLRCAEQLIENYNTNCASDVGCGVYGMLSCVRGAWLNVLINTEGMADNLASPFKAEGSELLKTAESFAAALHEAVLRQM